MTPKRTQHLRNRLGYVMAAALTSGLWVGPAEARPPTPSTVSPEARAAALRPGTDVLGVLVGEITPERRAELGAPAEAGIFVNEVINGSIADIAGVQPGDVIIDVGGAMITRAKDVRRVLARRRAGDLVTVQVIRSQAPLTLAATLSPRGGGRKGFKQTGPATNALDGDIRFDGEGPRARQMKRFNRRMLRQRRARSRIERRYHGW